MIQVGVVAPVMAVRTGLRAMLKAASDSNEPQTALEAAHQAASLEEYEPFISQTDVLVVTEGAASGAALRRALSQAEGQLALLLLADDPEAAASLPDLPLRAWGVLSIDVSGEELGAAVRALHQGLLVGTPALLEPILSRYLVVGDEDGSKAVEALTERENQVLQLLAHGLANKQIAASLGISEHTVKFHVSSIYSKLGVTNRTEAARIGVQQGLILL
jgi:DNA-binding NarL/FixJ family response regulator